MAEFDDIHRCTLGTSSFQLVDFKWREQPLPRGNLVFRVAIEGHGYVAADTPESLTSKLAAVAESFRTPGQDFEVFGVGGASLVSLLAAHVTGGGPFAGFELTEAMQDAPLTRSFRFTLAVERVARPLPGTPPGEDVPAERRLRTKPDGLREVGWAGTMSGADLEGRFVKLLKKFRDLYTWRRWVVQYEFEQNAAGDFARVLIAATETAFDLPGPEEVPEGGTGPLPLVRDGDGAMRWERDEQMRLVRTWDYDLLVVGDPINARDFIRAELVKLIGDAGVILRESMSLGLVQENRLRLSFETLSGGNGNALMNWTQSFRFVEPVPTYDVKGYPGMEPIIMRRPLGLGTVVQTGLAIGAGAWILPPVPALALLLEEPEIAYTFLNETDRQTTWTYRMGYTNGARAGLDLNTLKRPDNFDVLPG